MLPSVSGAHKLRRVSEQAASSDEGTISMRRLLPPGGPLDVAGVLDELGLWDRAERGGRLILNMVSTGDGRATLGGRSGAISASADRALFHGLRATVDAVLVGAGTARMERYGRIVRDEATRRLRRERGLAEEPLACIVSGRLALQADLPLLAEPGARVVILTSSEAAIPGCAAGVQYIRAGVEGRLDLRAGLAELRERFGARNVLCEGGPHLGYQLLSAGLLDELFLTLAPTIAGGEAGGGEALRIVAGAELEPPVALELRSVLESDSYLFLRYGATPR
jgi:riboflavin biosynthesis pyrimidine reductase